MKKTALSAFSRPMAKGIIAVTLEDTDYLIGVALTDGKQDVMLFSDEGKAIRFPEEEVRPMGRTATGVRGMRLPGGQRVISLLVAGEEQCDVLTATENGYGKRTPIAEYTPPRPRRAGHHRDRHQREQRQGGRRAARHRGRRDHADHHRRRADPHAGQGDPPDGPRHPGRARSSISTRASA